MAAPCGKRTTILFVEDDPSTQILGQAILEQISPSLDVQLSRNGEEARHYLAGEGHYRDRGNHPFPDLVITDLLMPRLSGFGLLDWIRNRSGLEDLPVIVTSALSSQEVIHRAAAMDAVYMPKPLEPDAVSHFLSKLNLL